MLIKEYRHFKCYKRWFIVYCLRIFPPIVSQAFLTIQSYFSFQNEWILEIFKFHFFEKWILIFHIFHYFEKWKIEIFIFHFPKSRWPETYTDLGAMHIYDLYCFFTVFKILDVYIFHHIKITQNNCCWNVRVIHQRDSAKKNYDVVQETRLRKIKIPSQSKGICILNFVTFSPRWPFLSASGFYFRFLYCVWHN